MDSHPLVKASAGSGRGGGEAIPIEALEERDLASYLAKCSELRTPIHN